MLQLVVGKGFATHQAGDLQSGVGNVTQHIQIAVFTAGTLAVVHLVQFLAQVATVAVLHERAITGRIQRHQPGILAAFFLRRLACRVKGALGQSGQVVLCEPQFITGSFLKGVLVKLQSQFSQTLGQFAITLTVSTLQIGTATDEAVVGLTHQHPVLDIMP